MTDPNGTPDRLAELERENARLREQLAETEKRYHQERRLLNAHLAADLPETDEELQRLLADSVPADQVWRELEAEFGPFPPEERA